MEEKVIEKVNEKIKHILDEDININNLDLLYKLSKIKHMAKEDKEMNYGNYGAYSGRGPGHGSYGNYGEYGNYGDNYGEYGRYGRRGYDMKYRGDDYTDRMSGEYHRYMESRERYGAGEESDKAFHFMAKALGEYIDFLHEEAQTPQQKQMLNETLQRSMR
jgi:hypothetical protein